MKNIGIYINDSKDRDGKILDETKQLVKNFFPNCNISIYVNTDMLSKDLVYTTFDFIIVLGGDGTILRTARVCAEYNIPLFGINIGNLGFLSSVEYCEMQKGLLAIKNGDYNVCDAPMLTCYLEDKYNNKYTYDVLNDIVISRGVLSRIATYEIYVDGDYYTGFHGDGIIIATPNGSTAYAFSAGGPVLHPDLNLMEITSICPHTPGVRSLVLDIHKEIYVKVNSGKEGVYLTIDGQEAINLKDINKINIKGSSNRCKLIRMKDFNYFNILGKKIIGRTKEN